ncbi:MAG: metal-dependent transcriptional regulator [Cryomorphaceae bacterium]
MEYSQTEENYLKAIYKLSKLQPKEVATKSIGDMLEIKPPTVSDMLKKLSDKKLIKYARYKGVSLTKEGETIALKIIRKHRLWETFLVEKFKFKWDEVHAIAEQLEHINSPELVTRLDEFLDYPQFDPHGDPIPDKNGMIIQRVEKTLDKVESGDQVVMVGVKDHSPNFLKYLESLEFSLGGQISVVNIIDYDKSYVIKTKDESEKIISHQVCKNIIIKKGDE